jgi:peptidoglycan/xylan/chitin deacetylase (PgdA/CDA1 family)
LNFQLAPEVRDGVVSSCFRAVFGDDERAISTRLYMDVGQLRELGSRRAVGTHGHDHVPLGRCSRAAVQESVRRSLELLTQWLGYRPYTLSYPYGSQEACTEQAGEGVAAAGIEFAFTMERAGNANLSNPLYLARFECNDLPGGNRAQLGIEELFERVARASWYRAPVHAPREPRPAGPVAGERV